MLINRYIGHLYMNKSRLFIFMLLSLLAVGAAGQEKAMPLGVGVTVRIKSAFLHEQRTINIYLPPGYANNDSTRFAVVYVPDGGIAEDFLHIAGLVQYDAQRWVNRLPPSIVVGIENTNRQRDFTFPVNNLDFLAKVGYKKTDIPKYGGSGAYIAFLEKELMPYIHQHYKTNGHNTVVGESLAGLFVTELFAAHRTLFDNYVIISPSLWWGNGQLINRISLTTGNEGEKHHINVYLGVPDKSEDTLMYNDALRLKARLNEVKNPETTIYFDYLPAETHATVMHQAAYNAFRLFSQKP
jgi:predicted alpha/beta superfamily hydrolase